MDGGKCGIRGACSRDTEGSVVVWTRVTPAGPCGPSQNPESIPRDTGAMGDLDMGAAHGLGDVCLLHSCNMQILIRLQWDQQEGNRFPHERVSVCTRAEKASVSVRGRRCGLENNQEPEKTGRVSI